MGSAQRADGGQREHIEGVRVPCWDAKRRVWKAIELLKRERRTVPRRSARGYWRKNRVGKPLPSAEDRRDLCEGLHRAPGEGADAGRSCPDATRTPCMAVAAASGGEDCAGDPVRAGWACPRGENSQTISRFKAPATP